MDLLTPPHNQANAVVRSGAATPAAVACVPGVVASVPAVPGVMAPIPCVEGAGSKGPARPPPLRGMRPRRRGVRPERRRGRYDARTTVLGLGVMAPIPCVEVAGAAIPAAVACVPGVVAPVGDI